MENDSKDNDSGLGGEMPIHGYSIEALEQLDPEHEEALNMLLHSHAHHCDIKKDDTIRSVLQVDETLPSPNDILAEIFGLWMPCEGCVPDGYTENLHENIIEKFYAIYKAGIKLHLKSIRPNDFETAWWSIRVVVQPCLEDSTFVVVHDGEHVLIEYERKAWHYEFETLKELANEVLRVRDEFAEVTRNAT